MMIRTSTRGAAPTWNSFNGSATTMMREIHYLVENYRSTEHIVAAANALIGHNRDRMKTGHPIRRDPLRPAIPPGWLGGT